LGAKKHASEAKKKETVNGNGVPSHVIKGLRETSLKVRASGAREIVQGFEGGRNKEKGRDERRVADPGGAHIKTK